MSVNNPYGAGVVLLVVILVVVPLPHVAGVDEKATEKRTVVDGDGIVYNITFSESNSTVSVDTLNPTEWDNKIAGFVIEVDGQRIHNVDYRLNQSDQRTENINITPGINVNQDNHTVEFLTYENSTQFNFTREINSSNPEQIPTPYISDVELTTGTVDGQQSTVANVTIVNPSEQLYGTKLMVHTEGTDGSFYLASVRPGYPQTIKVELLDNRDAEITGEVRLYTGNLTTGEGAMDQVEFSGTVGNETRVWNTSYEPVKPTWMDDHYQYTNDSNSKGLDERLSGDQEVEGVPVVYFVAALLVGGIAIWKVR